MNVLKTWLLYHPNNPFPTLEEMHTISRRAGVSVNAIRLWFENRRKRTALGSVDAPWSTEGEDDDRGGDHEVEDSVDHDFGATKPGRLRLNENDLRDLDEEDEGDASQFSTATADSLPKEPLTLKRAQADVLRSWLYNNKANPVLGTADFDELVASTKLSQDQIQRWMNFALKKGVQRRLFPVWRKKGDKLEVDERVSFL